MPASRHALTAALFVLLAALHTWPLASAPAALSRNDNADTMLNEWILAWVAHQLPHDPLRLFDANIFHPEPRALTFSEHLFVPALMAAPLLWLGASPVLAYNLVLLAGFALTGWAMAVVIARWTGDRIAGALAGCLAAFNAHTLTRLPHVQALHVEFLPLALLALDRALGPHPTPLPRLSTGSGRAGRVEARKRGRGNTRAATSLAVWIALQGLTSGYLLVFTFVALTVAVLVRPREWAWAEAPASAQGESRGVGEPHQAAAETRGRRGAVAYQRCWTLLMAAVLAAAVMLPFLLPYDVARREQGLSRSLDEVARYSASLRDYLSTAGRVHFAAWSHRFYRGTDALFPGFVTLALAGVAVATGVALRDRRARMLLAIAVAGFALSFGPAFPPYAWLYRAVPLFEGIRGAARFGYLFLFGLAGLAGFGLAEIRRRGPANAGHDAMSCGDPADAARGATANPSPARAGRYATASSEARCRVTAALPIALVVLANLEALRAPLVLTPFNGLPPIYDALAAEPDAVVVEFPFYPADRVARNAPYVLASTRHWKPLLNGYSGFTPPSYVRRAEILSGFPDDRSMAELRASGVTHVVVHTDELPGIAEEIAEAHELVPMMAEGGIRIYRLSGAGRRPG